MVEERQELLGMTMEELEEYAVSIGEPGYRGRQIYKWIYQKVVASFDEMLDLPAGFRKKLQQEAVVSLPCCLKEKISVDGTRKFLFGMKDKQSIEAVVIPQARDKSSKYSLCISTQVGCPIGCTFCATGSTGFQRNLKAYEIVGQVLASRKVMAEKLNNSDPNLINSIVYMGMGEPLLNYAEVIKSIRLLIDNRGINIGQRHITVSTSGEVKGIQKLAKENLQVTLAISLHACNNELRDRLVSLNKKYPIEELMKAVESYIHSTNRRVTFEYILLDEVNTSKADAEQLIRLVKPLLANVNLIPYNEVEGIRFRKPSGQKINQFCKWLTAGGINAILRAERGSDIEAACGQLKLKATL